MSDSLIQQRSGRDDLWRTPAPPRPGSDWALLAIGIALIVTAAAYGTSAAIRDAIDTAGADWPIFKGVLWAAGLLPLLLFVPAFRAWSSAQRAREAIQAQDIVRARVEAAAAKGL